MQQTLRFYWNQFRGKRVRRRWSHLLGRHNRIVLEGISLRCHVLDVYTVAVFHQHTSLLRLKLRINILDGANFTVISKVLVEGTANGLAGKSIRFKFLPGDLSQIVIPSFDSASCG